MLILGVPDSDLVRDYWRAMPGQPGRLALRHVPTGVEVSRLLPNDVSVLAIHDEIVAELAARLRAMGVMSRTTKESRTDRA